MKNIFISLFLGSVILTSCLEERDCNARPNISGIDQEKLQSDIQEIEQYLEAQNIDYFTDASGIRYSVLKEGIGDNPDNCNSVEVNFEGRIIGVDSTFDTGIGSRFAVDGNLIAGWKFGLYNMKNRGDYKLYVPSGLAYGADTLKNGIGEIIVPPHSNLEFRIRINQIVGQ